MHFRKIINNSTSVFISKKIMLKKIPMVRFELTGPCAAGRDGKRQSHYTNTTSESHDQNLVYKM